MWMNWWMGFGAHDRQPGARSATPQARGEASRTQGSDRLAPAADLVSQSQVWGFSTAAARRAVHGRTWKDLLAGWDTTATMLATERSPSRLLATVILRAALLDEMETQHPEPFAAWLGEQYGHLRRRR